MNAVEAEDFAALLTSQIVALSAAQIKGLATGQVAALTTSQMKVVTAAQLKSFTTDQIVAIEADNMGVFSAAQVQALTGAQLAQQAGGGAGHGRILWAVECRQGSDR